MEELLAYAYLLREDLISEELYENKLNELFISNPDDNDLLELELLSSNIEKSIIYILTGVNYSTLNRDLFGKTLINLLKDICDNMELQYFAHCMYSLWESIAGNLQDEEPFSFLRCIDDEPLLLTDTERLNKIYQKIFSYYD